MLVDLSPPWRVWPERQYYVKKTMEHEVSNGESTNIAVSYSETFVEAGNQIQFSSSVNISNFALLWCCMTAFY